MPDDKHEEALNLTEEALEKLDEGDQEEARRLLAEARKLDKDAPEEVLRDLDEDAATREQAGKTTG